MTPSKLQKDRALSAILDPILIFILGVLVGYFIVMISLCIPIGG